MTEQKKGPGDQLELPGDGEDESPDLPEQSGDSPDQPELGSEETVGEMLLAAREKKGLTLEAISQESKIPKGTLQNLETDNFEAIPAKVYATGFLRTYSQILGLDPAQLINKYEVQTGQTHKSRGDLWEIEEEVVEEKLGSSHLFIKLVIPVIVVIVLIIVLWKVFGGRDEGAANRTDTAGQVQVTEAESGRAAVNATDEGEEGGQGTEIPDGREKAPDEHALEEPPAGGAQPDPAADPPAAGEMSLRIAAEERIWFDLVIYNQSDTGLVTVETDFILEAGEERTFTSNESFLIRKIGRTEGFTIELDGRPYEVPIVKGRLPRDITISRGS